MHRPPPLQNLSSDRPYTSNYEIQTTLTPRTPHSRAGRDEEARHAGDETDYEMEVIPGLGDRAYDNPYGDQQQEPLLASSASASFPRRTFADSERIRKSRRLELSWELLLSRLPLAVGGTTALLLLFMIVLSLSKPGVLQSAIGASKPANNDVGEVADEAVVYPPAGAMPPTPTEETVSKTAPILSYANYTSFPLTPVQYLEECITFQNALGRVVGGYWYTPPEGPLDVVHKDDNAEYQKTKTHTHLPEMEEKKICSKSITYMLDGYVGLAADLALMAQVAGLAREVSAYIYLVSFTIEYFFCSKTGRFS